MQFMFLLVFLLCIPSCKTMDTKPSEQYERERPIRERPTRNFNDMPRYEGRP